MNYYYYRYVSAFHLFPQVPFLTFVLHEDDASLLNIYLRLCNIVTIDLITKMIQCEMEVAFVESSVFCASHLHLMG